ncbi:LytTR family DNA-binding domain-containing protein [Polaribacter sp. MSW13]|uniref:LytTR family DNA-binding domain-containing protein n=1 Tax=Polaribacter marinus TaxID=2916838 RepID=A0A9X2AI80_9FLAO|nr:LytTR family DNA-binding domain-containing protein [Polaribacter marinus]MCI2228311.1 LytTR family DNA-binding domain-containing protein [Polaribacter marinus]
MNPITAIIVDDEISNLKGLQKKMANLFPEINIIATHQKPEEAILDIEKKQPDILFLDVEMPRIDGFELLSKLRNINFQVIFVTAFSEYAIEAFKKCAVGYILKPIDDDDLIKAVHKAKENIELKLENKKNVNLLQFILEANSNANKLIIPTIKGVSFIPQKEVIHVEGFDGYTKIHLIDKTEIVSSYNIGKYEKMMSKLFYKCHKSHIINLEKVRHFENEGYIILENKKRVPVSKTKRKEFIDLCSQ